VIQVKGYAKGNCTKPKTTGKADRRRLESREKNGRRVGPEKEVGENCRTEPQNEANVFCSAQAIWASTITRAKRKQGKTALRKEGNSKVRPREKLKCP